MPEYLKGSYNHETLVGTKKKKIQIMLTFILEMLRTKSMGSLLCYQGKTNGNTNLIYL